MSGRGINTCPLLDASAVSVHRITSIGLHSIRLRFMSLKLARVVN